MRKCLLCSALLCSALLCSALLCSALLKGPLSSEDALWSSSLVVRAISQQYPERQEWPDRNELLVHEVFLRERQAFHEGPSLLHVLAVQEEDDALAVAAREPLLNLALKVQGNGRTNFRGHDFHDLLGSNSRFWRKDSQHGGDLGLRRCGLASRHGRQDRFAHRHCSAPLIPYGIWILLWYQWVPRSSLDAREGKRLPHAEKSSQKTESSRKLTNRKDVVLYGTRIVQETGWLRHRCQNAARKAAMKPRCASASLTRPLRRS